MNARQGLVTSGRTPWTVSRPFRPRETIDCLFWVCPVYGGGVDNCVCVCKRILFSQGDADAQVPKHGEKESDLDGEIGTTLRLESLRVAQPP